MIQRITVPFYIITHKGQYVKTLHSRYAADVFNDYGYNNYDIIEEEYEIEVDVGISVGSVTIPEDSEEE